MVGNMGKGEPVKASHVGNMGSMDTVMFCDFRKFVCKTFTFSFTKRMPNEMCNISNFTACGLRLQC